MSVGSTIWFLRSFLVKFWGPPRGLFISRVAALSSRCPCLLSTFLRFCVFERCCGVGNHFVHAGVFVCRCLCQSFFFHAVYSCVCLSFTYLLQQMRLLLLCRALQRRSVDGLVPRGGGGEEVQGSFLALLPSVRATGIISVLSRNRSHQADNGSS